MTRFIVTEWKVLVYPSNVLPKQNKPINTYNTDYFTFELNVNLGISYISNASY